MINIPKVINFRLKLYVPGFPTTNIKKNINNFKKKIIKANILYIIIKKK